MIGFALKSAFWITVILLLLPEFGGGQQGEPDPADIPGESAEASSETADALSFVSGAVADLTSFCVRQPAACEGGARFATAMGARVKDGALTLADLLERERLPAESSGEAASATAGTAAGGTLAPSDLEPAWTEPEGSLPPIE